MSLPIFIIVLIISGFTILPLLKKKLNNKSKRIIKGINLSALFLTLVLVTMWYFNIHLWNLTIEVFPFWVFFFSSLILFGFTHLKKLDKIMYGSIYFMHVSLLIILIIPMIGLGVIFYVYSPFIPDNIVYENKNVIVTDEFMGILGPKPSPTVYIKCGMLSHKFKTDISVVFSIDSVSLLRIDDEKLEVKINSDSKNFEDSNNTSELVKCNCY